jgi:hypothetical protein
MQKEYRDVLIRYSKFREFPPSVTCHEYYPGGLLWHLTCIQEVDIMVEKKTSLYSQDNLTIEKSGDSVEQANKDESQIKEETVRFKVDIECSKDFAQDILREYFFSFNAGRENQVRDGTGQRYPIRPPFLAPNQLPAPTNEYRTSRPEGARDSLHWIRKASIPIFLILLMSISAYAGNTYLKYYKKQVSERVQHEVKEMNTNFYEAILAQNLNNLLNKLDELTAIPRLRNAFPEITSMSAIVRFKRGPEPSEKAKAAIEFLCRVKCIFDSWTERPHDLSTKVKPTEEDKAIFLSIWGDTEVLLEKLEKAKQKPAEFLITGHSL